MWPGLSATLIQWIDPVFLFGMYVVSMTRLEEITFGKWLMSLGLQWSAFKKQSYHIFRYKMCPPFLVRSLLILCIYQHSKQEVGSWWLGEKEPSWWTTRCQFCSAAMMTLPGGLRELMAPKVMLKR